METLFDLLGVDFAKEGDKAGKSAKKFKSLGVEIDLQCFGSGVIPMGHTQDRKEELSSVLNGILKEKAINTKQAESLRGRLTGSSHLLLEGLQAALLKRWVTLL